MSQITTHILNTSTGQPAANVEILLFSHDNSDWVRIAAGETNEDGRVVGWLGDETLAAGDYKILFQTKAYFERDAIDTFYPYVEIVFTIAGDGQHYHVPLLLNPYGYSTYRGS